ncbi:protein toll-like [Mercenaria mercenaria]|uniref:protein toll-like n=1 Tax=Mercenaria mercenaria TaxID=6596 RepID=UPI00234E95F3|nr:protein toll-like [Mercenaria mercenaria]
MRQTVIVCVIFCFYSRSLASKPCVFSLHLDSKKSLNGLNVTSDGSVLFMLMGIQNNCSIDLDFVYEQTRLHTLGEVAERSVDEAEVFKEFNFFCDQKMAVHFVTNKTNVAGKLKISVALVFGRCDVYLEEISLFLKYGNIWSILQSNDSVIHAPSHTVNCQFATHIRIIAAKINCGFVTLTHFFWESCKNIFEKLNILRLKACKTNHFSMKPEILVKSFPKLQSVQLMNIDLTTQMTFPWTQSYFNVADQDLMRFLSNETETNVTVAAMRRSIWIHNSKFNSSNMFHLNGNIETVVINNAHIKQNERQMFENVTGLGHVDLSSNNLTEIDKLLFENQSNIKAIHLKDNKLSNLPPHIFEDQHKLVFLDLSNNLLSLIDPNLLENQLYLQELHLEKNRLQFLPQDFLKEQIYTLKFLYLYSNPLKNIPVMPFYGTHIEIIDIHNSHITGESIVELVNSLRLYDFISASAEREAYDLSRKVGKHPLQRRELDLSYCKIRDIRIDLNIRNKTALNLLKLLESFYIKGNGNPFTCNCQLYVVTLLLSAEEKQSVKMDWTCMYPQELQGMKVSSLSKRDIYCPLNVTDCPILCVCYVRYDFSSLIIDCRNINVSSLPLKMPKGRMELWFKNTSLLALESRDYLLNVSVLDLSENKLTYIAPLAASKLQNVDILNLENNDLTSLPVQIKYKNISRISLTGNAFLCDCHTRWMRAWLHDRLCPVTDWNIIKCTDNYKKVNKFINLPDSIFVCNEIKAPSIAEHVIFPSVVIGSILFVITVLSLTIYFQRFTLRVLLYMFFGVRICDGFADNPDDVKHSCVVIYDKNDEDFVENNIKIHLQESGYNVADMYKDPVIGFTLIEGIRKLIYRSRRVLFCMSKQSLNSELMITLWNIAAERAMKIHIGSIILIVDKEFKSNCTGENMKLFIKNGRYIRMDSKMLYKSIEYLMSTKKRMNQNQEEVNHAEENNLEINQVGEIHLCEHNLYAAAAGVQKNLAEGSNDTYIVYPDVIDELHQLTRYEIIPFLRENKQNVYVLQDEFVFGEDIRLGIEPKLDKAKHVIFIISNETLEDDVSQFILTTILTKAVVSGSNYLLLFSYGQIDVDKMPENLKKYVNSYITASVNDPNFKERMLEALMFEENGIDKEDTDSLLTENDIDDASLI